MKYAPHEFPIPDTDSALDERVRTLCAQSGFLCEIIERALDELSDEANLTADLADAENAEWHANRTLFVTGPHASGKSAIAGAALVPSGFALFDTGPLLRGYHKSERPGAPFGQWVDENEAEYGATFTDELLAHHIGSSAMSGRVEHPAGIVVVGNRSFGGVRYLAHRLQPPDARLVYVDAGIDLLYERYRRREGRADITPGQFKSILDADMKLGLGELVEQADLVTTNEGTLDDGAQHLSDYVQTWTPTSP